jgi:Beta-carotene isomerase D27-like, C-terminal
MEKNSSNTPPTPTVVTYKDSPTDIAFMNMCRVAYGNISGWQSPRAWDNGVETFQGMIEVSRSLMKGRTASQQRDAVIKGFPSVPSWFRKVFPYSKWGAEINAKITPAFFTWLVGPMQTIEVEFERPNGEIVTQNSGVHIERCRYLAESGCVGICGNLCKAPCQSFFTEQLGMPLTMEPNFEDMSCKMIFGKVPLPLEQDPVYQQGCLRDCSTAMSSIEGGTKGSHCYKLD